MRITHWCIDEEKRYMRHLTKSLAQAEDDWEEEAKRCGLT